MAKIAPVAGWILLTREEIDEQKTGDWYIAWLEPFRTKRAAIAFARVNHWQAPFRAVRGKLSVD